MILNLKAMLLPALAAVALWAAASEAQASKITIGSDETTLTMAKDGLGKTAHQVFDIRKADGSGVLSLTCEEIAGDATAEGPEVEDLAFQTPALQGTCNFAGQFITVQNTGCNFTLAASGLLHIVDDGANNCEHGQKSIHYENTNLNCKVEIAAQTISGVKFHNLEDGTITVEQPNLAFSYNASGSGCPYGTTSNGQATTGNFLIKGEKKKRPKRSTSNGTNPKSQSAATRRH